MAVEIDPAEVNIEARRYDRLFFVDATWRGCQAGMAKCVWDDHERTRLLLADLKVEHDKLIEKERLLWPERRANFRRLGIGRRLLREVVRQAPLMGARELFGKIVDLDLEPRPFLLDWYAREGFEIREPDPGAPLSHRHRIVMRFE